MDTKDVTDREMMERSTLHFSKNDSAWSNALGFLIGVIGVILLIGSPALLLALYRAVL